MLKWGNGPLQENLTVLKQQLENLLGEKILLVQFHNCKPEQAEKPWVMMGERFKLLFWQLNNQFVEISQTLEMLFPPDNKKVGIGIKYNFRKRW